ncbi:hypothetical protein MRX96_045983 [Rhipicephalus microplus]
MVPTTVQLSWEWLIWAYAGFSTVVDVRHGCLGTSYRLFELHRSYEGFNYNAPINGSQARLASACWKELSHPRRHFHV